MLFATDEFRHLIIRDTLKAIDEWSSAHENLLLGTAAQESQMGAKLKQGRRLGIYHISPSTHRNVWDKYLLHHPDLASRVRGLAGQHSFINDPHGELVTNLKYATAIAWLIYKRTQEDVPTDEDIQGQARFWYRHFRSKASGHIGDYIAHYKLHILDQRELVA